MSTSNIQLSPHIPRTTQGTSTANNRAFHGFTAFGWRKQSDPIGFHQATASMLKDEEPVSVDSTDS
jgi:hypothetical protein